MSILLSSVLERVNDHLEYSDTTVLSTAKKERLIENALSAYSVDRPKLIVIEITNDDSGIYTLPSNYDTGFSVIKEIEYPTNQSPKQIVPDKYYFENTTPTGRVLVFNALNPGGNFWFKYTIPYVFDSSGASDVPASDLDTFSFLATSLICIALATYYANNTDPSLPEAEVIGFPGRSNEFTSLASTWMKKYKALVTDDVTGMHGSVDYVNTEYFDRDNL